MSVIGSYSVHLLEVGNLIQVADVDDGEILDAVSNAEQDLVLRHSVWIPISAETDDYEALFFGHLGAINVSLSHACAAGRKSGGLRWPGQRASR